MVRGRQILLAMSNEFLPILLNQEAGVEAQVVPCISINIFDDHLQALSGKASPKYPWADVSLLCLS